MSNKGIAKNMIIIIVVAIIVVLGVLYFAVLKGNKSLEYYKVRAQKSSENILIKDYKTLSKILKNNVVNEKMTNSETYQKVNVAEYFNEEYFKNKNLALISVYEDTSKAYIYCINDITYNNDETQATINYTYKTDGYAGNLSNAWYEYFFVELDKKVESVIFNIDNDTIEK